MRRKNCLHVILATKISKNEHLNQHIYNAHFEGNNDLNQHISKLQDEIKELKSSKTKDENFENITTEFKKPELSKVLTNSVQDGKKSFICNDFDCNQ